MSAAYPLCQEGIQADRQEEEMNIAKNMPSKLRVDTVTAQEATELSKVTLEKILQENRRRR